MNIVYAVIAVIVSFVIAFAISYYLAKKDNKLMKEIGE